MKLEIYIDIDQAENIETKNSVSKYLVFFNRTIISWSLKYKTTIVKSLYKMKYITALKIVKKAIQISCFLEKLYQI